MADAFTWPYREGRCQLCDLSIGGRGVICDQCWRGAPYGAPHNAKEPMYSRDERRKQWERTGKPSRPRWRITY